MKVTDNFFCPVCDGRQSSVLLNKVVAHPLWWVDDYPDTLQLRYVLCGECGYIGLRPHLSVEEYDAIYRLSPGLDRKTIKEERALVLTDRRKFISKHASALNAGTVLEAGPAYGDFLSLFSEFERRVGVEPSKTYLNKVVEEGLNLDYYPFVLEDFSQHQPEFIQGVDLVLACHVLEHAFDPKEFVANLAKLAKKGAYVYIEVPSIEGMAEIEKPLYQNLYYGHVSQFSVPVITRLGVDCGLSPVKVSYCAKKAYPVIHALFRKEFIPDDLRGLFERHRDSLDKYTASAIHRLTEVLRDNKLTDIVIWGCGQDLLDLVSSLNERDRALFRKKTTLVDRNPGKQGKCFFEKMIVPPSESGRADAVLIATNSQILNVDIARDVKSKFSDVTIINLYDVLPE